MKKLILCIVMWAMPSWATTYYVDATPGADCAGNYSIANRNCEGSDGTSKDTIPEGIALLSGGDTLYVRSGTYLTGISYLHTLPPSGASWAAATQILSYPGETPTIAPNDYKLGCPVNINTNLQYIIISGFVMDGTGCPGADVVNLGGGASYIRIQNSEVKNSVSNQGISIQDKTCTHNEFINLSVHNNGSDAGLDHGFYLNSPYSLIEGCDIYSNFAYGIQLYKSGAAGDENTGIVVRNNKIHDNGTSGVTLNHGDGIQFYNNLVYDNVANGVNMGYNATTNVLIYNNTIYSNGTYGMSFGATSVATGTIVKNNIVYGNGGDEIKEYNDIVVTYDDNLCDAVATGCEIGADPLFVNAPTDLKLSALTSPAVDVGTTLTTVTNDYTGNGRPMGKGYDIGAYEFIQLTSPKLMLGVGR